MSAADGHCKLIPLTSKALKRPHILRRKRHRSDRENYHPQLILPSSTPISKSHSLDSSMQSVLPDTSPLNLPFSPSRVSTQWSCILLLEGFFLFFTWMTFLTSIRMIPFYKLLAKGSFALVLLDFIIAEA